MMTGSEERRQEMDNIRTEMLLEEKYLNKYVVFKQVNNKLVYGKIDSISIDHMGNCVFVIDRKRYEVDQPYLTDNLALL